jgi:hypothetical protein
VDVCLNALVLAVCRLVKGHQLLRSAQHLS